MDCDCLCISSISSSSSSVQQNRNTKSYDCSCKQPPTRNSYRFALDSRHMIFLSDGRTLLCQTSAVCMRIVPLYIISRSSRWAESIGILITIIRNKYGCQYMGRWPKKHNKYMIIRPANVDTMEHGSIALTTTPAVSYTKSPILVNYWISI